MSRRCDNNTCKALNVTSGTPQEKENENLVEILENLTTFLSASAELLGNLKETVEKSKMESKEQDSGQTKCNCPEKCAAMEQKGKAEQAIASQEDAKGNETELNQAFIEETKGNQTILNEGFIEPAEGAPAEGAPADEGVPADDGAPANEGTPADSTMQETNTPRESGPKTAAGDVTAKGSVDTVVEEPKYENLESCSCDAKIIKSKSAVKESKSGVKQKSQKNQRKQLTEKFTKEKTEKFAKLKESITIAQSNLTDIQEQLRQLERLFQDYESVNTPDGQVNPAALYREIMKPQTVPYISFTQSTPKVAQCPKRPSGACVPSCQKVGFDLRDENIYQNPSYTRRTQEKISVLSAVPLDEANCDFY